MSDIESVIDRFCSVLSCKGLCLPFIGVCIKRVYKGYIYFEVKVVDTLVVQAIAHTKKEVMKMRYLRRYKSNQGDGSGDGAECAGDRNDNTWWLVGYKK